MSCRLTNEELNHYLDGMLNVVEAGQVEQHLVTCKECSIKYDHLYQLVQDLRGLQSLRAKEDTAERVVSAIAEGHLPETGPATILLRSASRPVMAC